MRVDGAAHRRALFPMAATRTDGAFQDGKDSQRNEEGRERERPRAQIILQKLELPELLQARHRLTRSTRRSRERASYPFAGPTIKAVTREPAIPSRPSRAP